MIIDLRFRYIIFEQRIFLIIVFDKQREFLIFHSISRQAYELDKLIDEHVSYSSLYASERFGSVRFRFGFCHTGSKPARNRTGAGSVRFGSVPDRFGTEDKEYKKLLI
jgi:hypothetical protein